jgi:cobalt-zinc-cadmium efflux system outer membrane protein
MPDGTDPTKDEVMVNFGVSVPLWFGKYRAMAKEAQEMEAATVSEAEAQRLQLRADLAQAYFNLNNSSRLVRLYRETLLPQSRQALQSAEELYRKGQANLSGVLETTATVHNFELARLRATTDFYQNVARIEKLLGTALELRPVADATQTPPPAPVTPPTTEPAKP